MELKSQVLSAVDAALFAAIVHTLQQIQYNKDISERGRHSMDIIDNSFLAII